MKAVIFPGQGAQYVGMGKSLSEHFPEARSIFAKIDNVLGFALSKNCFSGPAGELKDTSLQQLAILAVSLAAFEAFKVKDLEVVYFSGLSLGEYSCLYAADVLDLADLVRLVRLRGQAMQEAAEMTPSTMFASIGLAAEELEELSGEGGFYLANLNSARQVTVSLKRGDERRVKDILESRGAKIIKLEVSGGFHSPFMAPAKKRLKDAVDNLEFREASRPIVSNFSGKPHKDKREIKSNLIEQLTAPVLWKNCVEYMVAAGVETFFEVGPSRVLRGLIKKIAPQVKVINLEKKEDICDLKKE